MKFGARKPSFKKTIKAHTTSKAKRAVKRSVNPLYGKKGMGWVNDPKQAAYNKVYKQTTFDATGRSRSSRLGCLGVLFGLFSLSNKQPTRQSAVPAKPTERLSIEDATVLTLTLPDTQQSFAYHLPNDTWTDRERLQANEGFILYWLNRVTPDALETINGIGERTANGVCAHSPYTSLDEIRQAKNGMGEALLITVMHALDEASIDTYIKNNQTT